jgi:hypothetical protein
VAEDAEPPVEEALELMRKLLRDGKVILVTDPNEIAQRPLPTIREAAAEEWRHLDALIAGARLHGTLTEEAIAKLKERLAAITNYLRQTQG